MKKVLKENWEIIFFYMIIIFGTIIININTVKIDKNNESHFYHTQVAE